MIRSSAKNSKTDEQLIEEFRHTGSLLCIEILFNRYCHLVFAVALKYLHSKEESKDAVIDIFAKVPDDVRKYEIRNFSHWIYIVTKNYCYHALKNKVNYLPEEAIYYKYPSDDAEDLELSEQGELLKEHLAGSIHSLKEEQQVCIRLFYFESKSYEEIERITGYSYNQVKSYIQNGKRNLKIYLEKVSGK